MPLDPRDCRMLELALQHDGFAFVGAGVMHALLEHEQALSDWPAFAASWNDLATDNYLAQVGLRRRRRHAVFSAGGRGEIQRQPHQPHYQSRDYNALQGGIERWFEPVRDEVGDSACLRATLAFCRDVFSDIDPQVARWHIEAHQFRIEALPDNAGQPTPEGVHRDGVDYVLVLLIDRHNISSGTTSFHLADGSEIGSFTLTRPFDAALANDRLVYHGVTAVSPLDPEQPAWRDVLVLTFRAVEA